MNASAWVILRGLYGVSSVGQNPSFHLTRPSTELFIYFGPLSSLNKSKTLPISKEWQYLVISCHSLYFISILLGRFAFAPWKQWIQELQRHTAVLMIIVHPFQFYLFWRWLVIATVHPLYVYMNTMPFVRTPVILHVKLSTFLWILGVQETKMSGEFSHVTLFVTWSQLKKPYLVRVRPQNKVSEKKIMVWVWVYFHDITKKKDLRQWLKYYSLFFFIEITI